MVLEEPVCEPDSALVRRVLSVLVVAGAEEDPVHGVVPQRPARVAVFEVVGVRQVVASADRADVTPVGVHPLSPEAHQAPPNPGERLQLLPLDLLCLFLHVT